MKIAVIGSICEVQWRRLARIYAVRSHYVQLASLKGRACALSDSRNWEELLPLGAADVHDSYHCCFDLSKTNSGNVIHVCIDSFPNA